MYKITIEHTKVEEVIIGKEWANLGSKEVARDPQFATEAEPTRITENYDYTPETKTRKTVTRKIYEQTVDQLNVAELVKVVNNPIAVPDIPIQGEVSGK